MKFIDNKKGFFLAEETMKIVLALICVAFLVYFLVSIYYSNQKDKNFEFAKSSLQGLVEAVNSKSSDFEIFNPKGFYILSWPLDDIRPASCENLNWANCICICQKSKTSSLRWLVGTSENEALSDDCDEWPCLQAPDSLKDGFKIKISTVPFKINIKEISAI